jgi:3-oxoacyl-[acyl-carrier-protein] synthase-3
LFTIRDIALAGIEASFPGQIAYNAEEPCIPEEERELFIRTTGISQRRIAPVGTTAADLCFESAQQLMSKLGWAPESVEILVFVTQTPDFTIPGTSMHLQARLGLPKTTACLDLNQGCAGYPYGLSLISSMMSAGGMQRGLLLVGDTLTRFLSPQDKSTWPIFSDAGTATAMVREPGAAMHFNLCTDGTGLKVIQTPEGGARQPFAADSLEMQDYGGGICRNGVQMSMDGMKVFSFATREVPANVQELLQYADKTVEETDAFVFHQANLLMNETIRRKLQIPPEKVPYSIGEYGNTSCATIPVTIWHTLRETLQSRRLATLLSGFGVGLSWGSVWLEMGNWNHPTHKP